MRTSTASAIAAAVEHHPQKGHETVEALKALYRDKVGHPLSFALVVSDVSRVGQDSRARV